MTEPDPTPNEPPHKRPPVKPPRALPPGLQRAAGKPHVPPLRPYGVQAIPRPPAAGSAVLGFLITLLCHVIWLLAPIAFFFVGIVQLVYVIPLCGGFLAARKKRTAAGVAIAAAVTLLVNGLVCGAMFLRY
jgi:hypothetical protein